jgi:phosphoglycolate phosphatase
MFLEPGHKTKIAYEIYKYLFNEESTISIININTLSKTSDMAIKNIIFDWSGVISDDKKINCYEAGMRLFARYKVKRMSYKKFCSEFDMPYLVFYHKYIHAPANEIERIYSEEIKKLPLPKVYPEAKKVLVELKKQGYHMTIFSSMSTNRLSEELKQNGLLHIFVSPKSGVRDKVLAFKEFIHENGYKKKETLYVADMVHDIHAAKRAGIRIVSIVREKDPYDPIEKIIKEEPDYIISNLKQLIEIVEAKNEYKQGK